MRHLLIERGHDSRGEFRVFNQFTEQFSVSQLAELVQRCGGELGYDVEIEAFPNPRVELEQHYYNASTTKQIDIGLEPHPLGEELVHSVINQVNEHRDRVIFKAITPRTKWNPGELEGGALQVGQET